MLASKRSTTSSSTSALMTLTTMKPSDVWTTAESTSPSLADLDSSAVVDRMLGTVAASVSRSNPG